MENLLLFSKLAVTNNNGLPLPSPELWYQKGKVVICVSFHLHENSAKIDKSL